MDRLSLGYLVYNRLDYAEAIVRAPTPVGPAGTSMRTHATCDSHARPAQGSELGAQSSEAAAPGWSVRARRPHAGELSLRLIGRGCLLCRRWWSDEFLLAAGGAGLPDHPLRRGPTAAAPLGVVPQAS
eukprot:COSAG04_NODE_1047_length_8562_cov_9.403167_15_plen_128_part_00